MKVYKCDCCGKVITNPYKETMKEFFIDYPFEFKRRVRLHLCNKCFHGLHSLAETKALVKNG